MKVFTSAAAAIIIIVCLVSVGHGATGLSGADMYAARCESCHGKITETSIIRGATSTMMEFAIKSNFGGMKQLSGISSNDLQSISSAIASYGLTSESSAGGSSTPNIPSSRVYTSSGAAQAAEVQSVPEKSLPAVAAVASNSVPAMATATPASSEPVAAAPASFNVAPDGASLYASNCAFCHGPIGSTSKRGASFTRIQTAIGLNSGGMASLASMQATDLMAIASALNTGGMSVSAPTMASAAAPAGGGSGGSSLYDSSCASCHGPLASSSKKGAAASAIQGAISANTGGMGSLSSLSAADIQSIADALAGSGGGNGGMSGSCISCHPNGVPSEGKGDGKGEGKRGSSKGGRKHGGGRSEGRSGSDD